VYDHANRKERTIIAMMMLRDRTHYHDL